MQSTSTESDAGGLSGGKSLDRSKTLSRISPSGPLRRFPCEIERLRKAKLPDESKELATGASYWLIPVTGGIKEPMGTGGAITG